MLYRPPSRPPVTAWAKHLDQVMRDRDWSRVRLFEEVGAELGYGPKSRSAFLPLLVDKEPPPDQAAILARHFGWPAEPVPAPAGATETPGDIATALLALAEELRLSRESRADLEQEVAALRLVVEGLVEPRLQGDRAPAARQATAE